MSQKKPTKQEREAIDILRASPWMMELVEGDPSLWVMLPCGTNAFPPIEAVLCLRARENVGQQIREMMKRGPDFERKFKESFDSLSRAGWTESSLFEYYWAPPASARVSRSWRHAVGPEGTTTQLLFFFGEALDIQQRIEAMR